MNRYCILLVISFVLIHFFTIGQVVTKFDSREVIGEEGKFLKRHPSRSPVIIPARNIAALLKQDSMSVRSGEVGAFVFAESIKLDLDVLDHASLLEDGGATFGKLKIVAAGAKSISLNFDQFHLPFGTALYIYNEHGKMITGPITEAENNANNFWGSWVYSGSVINIEFQAPSSLIGELELNISDLAYGFKEIFRPEVADFGGSSSCNINIACPLGNGWTNERNSVALILSDRSTSLCTGALVNNTCNLDIPYMLTANHCFPNQNVGRWKFIFQAWSATCSPSQNASGITFNGATMRASSAGSDFGLIELIQRPTSQSGITYSGWSRVTSGILNTTIIHHPAGDVMKISRDDQAPTMVTNSGSQEWRLILDQGTTNGGSSGAPYYDQNHRIIGQHHSTGNQTTDACTDLSKFGGRFDVSWTGGGTAASRLSTWLDPGNTGALTTDTRPIPYVSGPTLICSSGTFLVQNAVGSPSISWSSGNNSILTINASSGVATRVAGANGQVTISASLNYGGTCTSAVYTFITNVGPPAASNATLIYPSGQRGIDPVSLCAGCSYNLNVDFVTGASSYTWVLPTGFSFLSGSTSSVPAIQTAVNPGTYVLNCSVNNACGSSWTHNLTINIGGGGQQQLIASYPNPASNELVIEDLGASIDLASQNGENFYAEIIGKTDTPLVSGVSKNGKLHLNVIDVPTGQYILRINHKGFVTVSHLAINH